MKNLELFLTLAKVDVAQRVVYGVFACEEPDNSNEIMDYESSKPEFEKWSQAQFQASDGKSFGNVRAMHAKVAAGKVISLVCNDLKKTIEGAVKIVDEQEWAKVEAGVYTGFSVGGKYKENKLWKAAGDPANCRRYTAMPSEISLADKPCQPSSTFELIKTDGQTEQRKFQVATADIEQGFRAKDGTFFLNKIAAEKYNESLSKIVVAPATHPALEALKKAEDAASALEKTEDAPRLRLKREDGSTLEKMMCDISRLAEIVDGLKWLQECIAMDKETTGESSVNPDKVQKQVEALGATLVEMVTAEVEDMKAEKADGFTGIPAADLARLEKFNLPDGLKKVRAEANPEQEKATEDLAKVVAERDELKKVVNGLETGLEKLNRRLTSIERQPAAPKGAVRAVERGQELAKDVGKAETRGRSDDTLQMPGGLSPMDQREWIQREKQQRS